MRTSYVLDARERITAVGGKWDVFALENNNLDVLADAVIGRYLFEFISGASTSEFLSRLFHACRSRNVPLSMLCRCDAALLRRQYRMHVQPGANGAVEITHDELNHQPFRTGDRILDLRDVPDCHICSMCGELELDNQWVDSFRYPAKLPASLKYVICPTCKTSAQAEIARSMGGDQVRPMATPPATLTA